MCLDRHWMSDFSIFSWHLLTKLKNISFFFTYHCFFDKYSFLLFWIISKIVLVFWGAIFSFNLEKGHAKWSKWTPLTWIVQEGFKTSFWQRGKHLLHSFFKFMRYMRFTKALFEKKNWLGVPNWSRDFKLQAFLSCHIYTYYSVFYNYRFNTEIHTICKNIHSWDSLLFFHDNFFLDSSQSVIVISKKSLPIIFHVWAFF